jgi:hypothetical protein
MQIAGDKKLHVFNGADRTLLTVAELEGFCSGNIIAPYTSRRGKRMRRFTI